MREVEPVGVVVKGVWCVPAPLPFHVAPSSLHPDPGGTGWTPLVALGLQTLQEAEQWVWLVGCLAGLLVVAENNSRPLPH